MGFSSGGGDPGAWLDGAIMGATQGISQIGINYLMEELDLPPILEQMGSQFLSSIANSLVPGIAGVISHAIGSFADNALTVDTKPSKNASKYWDDGVFNLDAYATDMANWSWENKGYQQMSKRFKEHIESGGLEQAFNDYEEKLFNEQTRNVITNEGFTLGGYFDERLRNGNYNLGTWSDGTEYATVGVFDPENNCIAEAYFGDFDGTNWNNYLGNQTDGLTAFGDIFIDPYGDLKFRNGTLMENMDGYIVEQMFKNGAQEYIQFKDLYGEVVLGITPATEGGSIYMLNDGSLMDGFVTHSDGGFTFSNGELVYIDIDDVQFDFVSGDIGVTNLDGENIDIMSQGWVIMDKIATSYEEIESLLGASVAYADTHYETSDTTPEGQYAVRIYVARPDGLNYSSDKKYNLEGRDVAGHTFIALVDSQGNEIRRGLYPSSTDLMNPDSLLDCLVMLHVSDIRDDEGHYYHESTQWYIISVTEFNEINTFLDEDVYESAHPWYHLGSNNCTDLALNVADMLGIVLPYNDGAYSNPQSFANALLNLEISDMLGHNDFKIISENYLQDKTRILKIEYLDGRTETMVLAPR